MVHIGIDKSKIGLYKSTRKQLLDIIKPSAKQIITEKKFVSGILKKIEKMKGNHLSAIIAGSFGKETNLKDSKDFDIFVLYPPSLPRDQFMQEGLDIGQKTFKGCFWEKAYSQHPYIRGVIDGYKVEVVPAYKIEPGDSIISAVDRSPLHLLFVKKNITNSQKDDVRILKFFLKKIGCYGADSSISGFSGYLAELLILFYGDFLNTLEHVANWKPPIKFTLVKEQFESLERFDDSLVVIDPVDSTRNVASVVSKRQLNVFIAAARVFLENPSFDFFSRKVVKQMTYHQLIGRLENFSMVVIEFDVKNMLKEVIWSKVSRITKKLVNHLEFVDFNVLKYQIYHKDNTEKAYLVLMLDNLVLPKLKLVLGPLVSDFKNSQNYLDNNRAIFGPYIKEDRWCVIKQRTKVSAKSIIMDYAMKNFNLSAKIYVGVEIKDLYLKSDSIAEFFSDFFISKEKFLI